MVSGRSPSVLQWDSVRWIQAHCQAAATAARSSGARKAHTRRSALPEIPLEPSLHQSHLKRTSSASFQTGHLGLQAEAEGEGCTVVNGGGNLQCWAQLHILLQGLTGTCDLEGRECD